MKYCYLLFILILFYPGIDYAQSSIYDLNGYKMTDVRYSGLDFVLKGAGGKNTRAYSRRFIGSNNVFSVPYFQEAEGQIFYFSYRNTRKRQTHQNISAFVAPFDYYKTTTDRFISSRMNFYINNATFNYFGKSFLYTAPTGYFNAKNIQSKHLNEAPNNTKTLTSSVGMPIGWGKGRVELVSYAWMAARMLKRFRYQGLLSKDLTMEDVRGLADVLSGIKLDRVYDRRLDLIGDIMELDTYIREKGWMNRYGVNYFTTLYDYYLYGIQSGRQAGSRWFVGLDWRWNQDWLKGQDNNRNQYNYWGAFFQYDKFKPLSLNRQLDYSLSSFIGKQSSNFNNVRSEVDGYSVNLEGQVAWSFYPTTRTQYQLRLQSGLQYSLNGGENPFVYEFLARGSMYYYFSHRMAFSASAFAGRSDNKFVNRRITNDRIGISLSDQTFTAGYKFGFVYSLF